MCISATDVQGRGLEGGGSRVWVCVRAARAPLHGFHSIRSYQPRNGPESVALRLFP